MTPSKPASCTWSPQEAWNPKIPAIHANPPVLETKAKDWLKTYSTKDAGVSIHVDGKKVTVETNQIRLTKDAASGLAFDHVSLRTGGCWADLGTYGPVIWVRDHGQNLWESPDRIEAVERTGPRDLRLTLGGTLARSTVELRFFADAPYFLARIVSVQSTASGRLSLRGAYHYPLWRSDELAAVQPYKPGVPEYWLPLGAWMSPHGDYAYGALAQRDDSVFSISFWRDASLHADFLRSLDVNLGPTQTWLAPSAEPWAAIFLTRIDKFGRPDLSGVMTDGLASSAAVKQ